MTALGKLGSGLRTFASDIAQGFFEITHNGFALVGLAVVFSAITLTARPDLRQTGETKLRSWLQARQVAAVGMAIQPDAIDRATAANPQDLPKQQAAVAYWLSKKYHVAPEPLSALVTEAYDIGRWRLLGKEYDSAIEQLQVAANDPGVSSEVLNDLGVAYLLRDEPGDPERAKQQFDLALQRDPKFLPALFNLGLLYDSTNKLEDAGRVWQQYLDLDSESGWAKEVRRNKEDSKK